MLALGLNCASPKSPSSTATRVIQIVACDVSIWIVPSTRLT